MRLGPIFLAIVALSAAPLAAAAQPGPKPKSRPDAGSTVRTPLPAEVGRAASSTAAVPRPGAIGVGGSGAGIGAGSGTRIEVQGALSRASIKRTIHDRRGAITRCYERALAKRPELTGKVVVQMVIGAKGAVTSAAISETTLGNAAVESCVLQLMRGLRFQPPSGGGVVRLTYPFVFRSA